MLNFTRLYTILKRQTGVDSLLHWSRSARNGVVQSSKTSKALLKGGNLLPNLCAHLVVDISWVAHMLHWRFWRGRVCMCIPLYHMAWGKIESREFEEWVQPVCVNVLGCQCLHLISSNDTLPIRVHGTCVRTLFHSRPTSHFYHIFSSCYDMKWLTFESIENVSLNIQRYLTGEFKLLVRTQWIKPG